MLKIAEAGINHGGKLSYARKLADEAKWAGADVVKFQTYNVKSLLRRNDPDWDVLRSLSLTDGEFVLLARHCEQIGIEFMSTPGDVDSLKFLTEQIGVKRIKIGSDDLTNHGLLEAAYLSGKPVIISTGMATIAEVCEAISIVGTERVLAALHCVSLYPTPVDQANLSAIPRMRAALEIPIGYSDHTRHASVVLGAVALGASVIETHLRLASTGYEAIDHAVSYLATELKGLFKGAEDIISALGDGHKVPRPGEVPMIGKLRKGPDGLRGPKPVKVDGHLQLEFEV